MKNPPTINIKLGLKNTEDFRWAIVNDVGNFDSDGEMTTLKDISIILYHLCGNGVTRNLAEELSKELDIPSDKIERALLNIAKRYCEMNNDKAHSKAFAPKEEC